MKIVKELNTPFYLTGGTALHRHYYDIRFSDDLDLFVNNDSAFSTNVDEVFSAFLKAEQQNLFSIDYNYVQRSEYHTQLYITDSNNTQLKIDLVNDTAPHYGKLEENATLGPIDSLENILSNKIAALFRFEAKDYVDIWTIAQHYNFNWNTVITQAKTKEIAVDPVEIYNIMQTIPDNVFSSIKWAQSIDSKNILQDLKTIAADIFQGSDNSLYE